MYAHYREQIKQEFISCTTNTIRRLENEDTYRPFHAALLSEELLFWSRFERSFSTSFGQRLIEKVSQIAALAGGASSVQLQKTTHVRLSRSAFSEVDDHIGKIRGGTASRASSFQEDYETIRNAVEVGELIESRVISDIWWVKNNINHYMSIKTVKPNIDQTAEAKKDLLKLKLNDPDCEVYYGLYYNPYGESQLSYNWGPPMRLFNCQTDPVVLIGKGYWDKLGGNGFYEELLQIATEAGEITRASINAIVR